MFKPEEQERQLRESIPEFDKAKTRAEDAKEEVAKPIFALLDELRQEVLDMEPAARFSRGKVINPDRTTGEVVNPLRTHLTEASFKKMQLLDDVNTLRHEALVFASRLEDLIMDIEATKLD